MNKNTKTSPTSTYDRIMNDKKRKTRFDKEYTEFLVNEFILEAMEENHISVRKLAEKADVSPAVIQRIRSGESSNITLKKLSSIASVLGYRISFEKVEK